MAGTDGGRLYAASMKILRGGWDYERCGMADF